MKTVFVLAEVIAAIAISYTHLYWLDPPTGLVIMVVILVSTWGLLRDSFKMKIDAVPAGIKLYKIKQVITSVPNVKHVHHVHAWSISTTENALTVHVIIDKELPLDEKLKVIDKVKHELEQHTHSSQHDRNGKKCPFTPAGNLNRMQICFCYQRQNFYSASVVSLT